MQTAEPIFKGKHIAVCMDGTWQRLRTEFPTNIAKIARSVDHEDDAGAKQIVVYTQGVGAGSDLAARAKGALAGGLFGKGLEEDVLNTYVRICLNYQWGDRLYLFGYSRGAFSVRSLAGLIRRCGIVRRRHVHRAPEAFELYRKRFADADDPQLLRFRAETNKRPEGMGRDQTPPAIPIEYVGLFDTVGQRGLPSGLGPLTDIFNRKFEFHDLALSRHVKSARHAVAIDERRFAFPPTLWSNLGDLNRPAFESGVDYADLPYQQRWFPGTHGDIGGGDQKALMADFPLAWVISGAQRAGLKIDISEGTPLGPAVRADLLDPTLPFSIPSSGVRTRRFPSKAKNLGPVDAARFLHPVTTQRALLLGPQYRSETLRSFEKLFRQLRLAVALSEVLLLASAASRAEIAHHHSETGT